jgi:hypothetical protein
VVFTASTGLSDEKNSGGVFAVAAAVMAFPYIQLPVG